MVKALHAHRGAWAGVFAGPVAWGINTQANYALVPWVCAHKIPLVPILSLVLAAAALAGAVLSWLSWNRPAVKASETHAGIAEAPRPFLGAVGVLISVLFALVILTQGAAGLVLNGCER